MYDVIVLGATFAAAGIAHRYQDKCLVLERRLQGGYGFFGALSYGTGYETEPKNPAARLLWDRFFRESEGLYGCDAHIYPYLSQCQTVFGCEILSVEPTGDGFSCMTHGTDGFRSYFAKRVIDTRCTAGISNSKTYNLLIESREAPDFPGISWEKAGGQNRYVLRVPVSLSCGFVEARQMARNVIARFSETQRLILSADEFDYQVKGGYPTTEKGITYLPSKAFQNPILAFDAGLTWAEEVCK